MIIYKQNIENGIPIYEIITKTFKTITVKFDETFSKNDIYKLLSLLESDVDNMKLSYSSHFKIKSVFRTRIQNRRIFQNLFKLRCL